MAIRIGDETRARITAAWPDLLARLAAGELVSVALAAHGLSADMLRAYKADPARRTEWEDAREQSADAFMERALEMALDPFELVEGAPGEPLIKARRDPAHARMAVDTLKWAARIRNPRLYGDKAQLDVNVRTVDLTRIISDANARLAAARVIDGQVLRAALPAELESLL